MLPSINHFQVLLMTSNCVVLYVASYSCGTLTDFPLRYPHTQSRLLFYPTSLGKHPVHHRLRVALDLLPLFIVYDIIGEKNYIILNIVKKIKKCYT